MFKWLNIYLVDMRFAFVFIILILCFCGQQFAQEKDTLQKKMIMPGSPEISPRQSRMQLSSGPAFVPELSQDFGRGIDLPGLRMPAMDLNLKNGWKTQSRSLSGLKFLSGFPQVGNSFGLYRRSVWDIYQGEYGVRTYQVNNKLIFGTVGYSGRSFNDFEQKSGILRQTNYSSSLFVGYKFSDKFSISASFTIRRNGDPFNGNQGMPNRSIFP